MRDKVGISIYRVVTQRKKVATYSNALILLNNKYDRGKVETINNIKILKEG